MYDDDDIEIRNADMGDDDDFRNAVYDRRPQPWQPSGGGVVRRPVVTQPTMSPGPRIPGSWYNPPAGYPLPGYGQPYPGQMLPPGYNFPPGATPCGSAAYAIRPMNVGKVMTLVGVIVDVLGQGVAAILPLPDSPGIIGDQKTDDENMKRYQESLARHAKTDERIRTAARVVREALTVRVR
jgi:hypothetical protein